MVNLVRIVVKNVKNYSSLTCLVRIDGVYTVLAFLALKEIGLLRQLPSVRAEFFQFLVEKSPARPVSDFPVDAGRLPPFHGTRPLSLCCGERLGARASRRSENAVSRLRFRPYS